MTLVLILVIATGVLTPVVIALATLGSPLLPLGAVLAALVVEILCVVLWFDQQAEKKTLERRLRLVAAPLSGERLSDDNSEVEISVFRQRRAKSWLLERLDRHFSMIDAPPGPCPRPSDWARWRAGSRAGRAVCRLRRAVRACPASRLAGHQLGRAGQAGCRPADRVHQALS